MATLFGEIKKLNPKVTLVNKNLYFIETGSNIIHVKKELKHTNIIVLDTNTFEFVYDKNLKFNREVIEVIKKYIS
ncbi:hypothetical protein [Gottfriedia acidiceleris]|uniref:hypothetical protein n=1 Tax=Gottfriedia acidiceleris TaxID=371036 RepID=UPI00300098FF